VPNRLELQPLQNQVAEQDIEQDLPLSRQHLTIVTE
jgi:hypothetical protein